MSEHCPKCDKPYIRKRKVAQGHGFGNWFAEPHGFWYVHKQSEKAHGLIEIEEECYVEVRNANE